MNQNIKQQLLAEFREKFWIEGGGVHADILDEQIAFLSTSIDRIIDTAIKAVPPAEEDSGDKADPFFSEPRAWNLCRTATLSALEALKGSTKE